MGRVIRLLGLGAVVTMTLLAWTKGAAGRQEATASNGWVKLPDTGETTASAFAVVKNLTMYDIYLVSAVSEVADKVEFREAGDGEAKAVPEITVPAYGSVSMAPDGLYLLLVDLEHPLQEGENVPLTLTTASNIKLRVRAVVRKK